MNNVLKATAYRLRKTGAVKICILISCVAAVLYFVLVHNIATGAMDVSMAGSVSGLCDALIMWLTGSLAVGVIFCTDFQTKSIHCAIANRHGRGGVIKAYMILYIAMILILILPYTLLSVGCLVAGVDFSGAEPAMTSIYLMNLLDTNADASFVKIILVYIASAVNYVACISICIPIAIKVKKPVVITAIGFMIGMLTALICSLAEKAAVLKGIMRCLPYYYGANQVNAQSGYGTILLSFIVSVIFMSVMAFLSYLLFRKEDIK